MVWCDVMVGCDDETDFTRVSSQQAQKHIYSLIKIKEHFYDSYAQRQLLNPPLLGQPTVCNPPSPNNPPKPPPILYCLSVTTQE